MKSYVWTDSTWINGPKGEPIILLFGRDPQTKEAIRIPVRHFEPYFYTTIGNWNKVQGYNDKPDGLSCYGDEIKKVVVDSPMDIPEVRKAYDVTFEADVPFDIRYTADKRIFYTFDEHGNPAGDVKGFLPRIGYYDIEVRAPEEIMPSPENPIYPIVIMSLYDSYTDEVYILTLKGTNVDITAIENDIGKIYGKVTIHHIVCQSEVILIEKFAKLVYIKDFDVMTAWNGKKFDDPYYIGRARLLRADISGLSRVERKAINERKWTGRCLVDMMQFFKDWSKPMGKMPYGLKYVAKKFCNFSYDDQGAKIDDLMTKGEWDKLISYSVHDVVAMAAIDRKVNLFAFFENIRKVVGTKLNDCLSRSIMIESLLMKCGIKPMPTRTYSEDSESIEGATVLKPEPGIHEMVGTFDAKALYPTIIIMHNISPDIDKMIPKVIVQLMEEREKLRSLRMSGQADKYTKNSETAIKYIVNSVYGYMAFRGARLFKKELAAKVTAEGREVSKSIRIHLSTLGFYIAYGDTDSVFAGGITTPDRGKEIGNAINTFLVEWATSRGVKAEFAPTVKFEKLYSRILFKFKSPTSTSRKNKFNISPAKKRYAGHLIWKDGFDVDEMDYTGLETNRSDSALITRELMTTFLELILRNKDDKGAKHLVRSTYKSVKAGEVVINKIGIPKGISDPTSTDESSSNGAWLRGMRNATTLLGTRWSEEPKPYLLYLTSPVDVICIKDDQDVIPKVFKKGTTEMVDAFKVDYNIMADKIIKRKMEPLLMSIGSTWDETVNNQKTLFEF